MTTKEFGKSKFHPTVEFSFANEKGEKNLKKLLTSDKKSDSIYLVRDKQSLSEQLNAEVLELADRLD